MLYLEYCFGWLEEKKSLMDRNDLLARSLASYLAGRAQWFLGLD